MSLPTGFIRAVACLALLQAQPLMAAELGIARSGDLEMRCMAVPTSELTPEMARELNVVRDPQRGLLSVTISRDLGQGKTQPLQAQVFAGAINQHNLVSTIPVREVQQGDKVYYLGEFRVTPPDTLRFLVNASTLHGKPLKAEFSRAFGAP
jgi:hypothetical protein